ncbi:GNAT family N-acetyltransferase [Streptomyces sp. NPDC050617]|uniref:GNAT family N-acetyltransferase n=1 Tax=Streptomyces sp. NPDC050617 TaxID=3154628 RepID=UPI00342091B2
MTEVYLRRLTRWQADQQREAVADLYGAAYRGVTGQEFHDRRGFLDRFEEDVKRPGFDMVIAGGAGLAGCVYGFPPDRDGEFWKGFRGGVSHEIEELTALGRVFAIAELMVLPAFRRNGVATRLQEQLLARSTAQLVTVLVEPSNIPARTAYRSWGWTKFGELSPGGRRPELEAWRRDVGS